MLGTCWTLFDGVDLLCNCRSLDACLSRYVGMFLVKESTLVYYDSFKNNTGRPFSEYPDLRNLGDIEIHAPDVWQAEVECGCMVVLRFWQLFHDEQYNLKGKKARDQVWKYYNRDDNKGRKALKIVKGKQIKEGHGPLSHAKVFLLECWVVL